MTVYPSRSCGFMDTDTVAADGRKRILGKSLYQGNIVRFIPATYYSYEAVLLLFCLTMSLLILPLILPPLPPPPFLLLLLPIAILGVLVFLALAPSKASEITYAHV
uniref:Uncharacterized protein n=1 Tax=Kalanchoe fedtschenkoi TaxID=63787 RepID=A0A7N0V6U9_KALFE